MDGCFSGSAPAGFRHPRPNRAATGVVREAIRPSPHSHAAAVRQAHEAVRTRRRPVLGLALTGLALQLRRDHRNTGVPPPQRRKVGRLETARHHGLGSLLQPSIRFTVALLGWGPMAGALHAQTPDSSARPFHTAVPGTFPIAAGAVVRLQTTGTTRSTSRCVTASNCQNIGAGCGVTELGLEKVAPRDSVAALTIRPRLWDDRYGLPVVLGLGNPARHDTIGIAARATRTRAPLPMRP